MATVEDAIRSGATALQLALPGQAVEQLAQLVQELARWNRRTNLTAIREVTDMVPGHLLDSLAATPLLRGTTVLDVGTGAGFPGLPLAIALPGRRFTLLDSNGKKIGFVRHMIGELGLDNVAAVQARAETYSPPERFDTVIARAFAALPRTVALAGHLVAESGVLLALKGKYPDAELGETEELRDEWESTVIRLTVPGLHDHERHAVCLTRRNAERP